MKSKIDTNRTLKEAVQQSVPRIWNEIMADVDWEIDLDGAVELCLDADRPVTFEYMTKEEYKQLLKEDSKVVDKWARDALKGYF